jgi:hypothetical protein
MVGCSTDWRTLSKPASRRDSGVYVTELLLSVLIAGSATYYNPGLMDEVYRNRLAWGQVEPCGECVGMVALLDAERIGERVWLSFDGGSSHVGPMLVVDCATAGHREAFMVERDTLSERCTWLPIRSTHHAHSLAVQASH